MLAYLSLVASIWFHFEDVNIFLWLVCSRIHSWQRIPHYGPRRHVFWYCDTSSTQLDFLHHDWQDSRKVIASSCLSIWAMQFSLGLWKSDAPDFCTAPLGLRNQVPDLPLWSRGWTTSSVADDVGNRPKRMPAQTPALKRNFHCDVFSCCWVLYFISFHLNSFGSHLEMEERMYRSWSNHDELWIQVCHCPCKEPADQIVVISLKIGPVRGQKRQVLLVWRVQRISICSFLMKPWMFMIVV